MLCSSFDGYVLARVNTENLTRLVGNVIVWKPAPAAILSNYIVYQILKEAGLPDGVIQFVPGPAPEIVGHALKSPDFAGLHFTGSTHVFKTLWKQIAQNLDIYRSYPRIGIFFNADIVLISCSW